MSDMRLIFTLLVLLFSSGTTFRIPDLFRQASNAINDLIDNTARQAEVSQIKNVKALSIFVPQSVDVTTIFGVTFGGTLLANAVLDALSLLITGKIDHSFIDL